MIITAGKFKGRKLKIPKTDVRPTSSKVRESVFNMINVEGMKVLDLFAGSGVMGLEALSRGAKQAICVEKNPDVIKILKENLEIAKEDAKLIPGDAFKILNRFDKNEFDFIFIDPPYDSGLYESVLSKIKNNQILNKGGFIVIEHKCNMSIEADFEVYKTKKYGDTCIIILR